MRWVVLAGLVGEDRARSLMSENCAVRRPTKNSATHPQDRLPLGVLPTEGTKSQVIDWSSSTDHQRPPVSMPDGETGTLSFPPHRPEKPEHRIEQKKGV